MIDYSDDDLSEDIIPWGPTGQVVYDRTYSRTKPGGEKEQWHETVCRVARGNLELVYGPLGAWTQGVWQEYYELAHRMERFQIIPAGRHLWASGVKGRQYLFNCHVSGWSTPKLSGHFEFTFMRLMEGGGVGANYSSRYLERFGSPQRALKVHVVCDPSHPDYLDMVEAGLISTDSSVEWEGAFPVEDSREGWSAAMVDLIDTFMTEADVQHEDRVYDVSRVRGKGQPLRTFGGTASGPLPFARMMHEIGRVMNNSVEPREFGYHLTPIKAMEIDHAIAECVVSGGVRRSARMAQVHWLDPFIFEFINCKKDSGKHWTTNISVEIDSDFIEALKQDDHDWHDLAWDVHRASVAGMLTNGEPGYWNSSLSNVGEVNEVVATNPCTSSRTWILTTDGPKRVADLIGKPFTTILDGKPFDTDERGFYKTGTKALYRVMTDEGFEIEVTSNQELYRPDGTRVEVADLLPGDKLALVDQWGASWGGRGTGPEGYALGHLVGDGTFDPDGKAILSSWPNQGNEESEAYLLQTLGGMSGRSDWAGWHRSGAGCIRMSKSSFTELARDYGIVRGSKTVTEEVERTSSAFYAGFLAGLFDTDGHVEGNTTSGFSVRLSSIDMPALKAVQRMLARLGIKSSIRPMKAAAVKAMPGGEYACYESYRLIVSGRVFVQRYAEAVGFTNTRKRARLNEAINSYVREPYAPRVYARYKGHELIGTEDVYDCTIPGPLDYDGNGLRVRDCGEIALPDWGACVLGHVNLDAFAPAGKYDLPNVSGLIRAHELMTRFLIRATFGDMNDPKQKAVMDSERRIGVGHLGVQGYLAKRGIRYSDAPTNWGFIGDLDTFRDVCRRTARRYAFELRIPEPVKVTTVAPTGSVAKLPGVSEGCHAIYSRYFLRRVRFNANDPGNILIMQDAWNKGFALDVDQYDPTGNTWVVTYPTKDRLVDQVEALGYGAEIVESQDELTLEQLLAFQAMYQDHYADNAVSFTVNIPAQEHQTEAMAKGEFEIPAPTTSYVDAVAESLLKYLPKLKGTTIMVDGSRPQAPYERITEAEYEAAEAKRVEDGTDEDCANGACPVR